MRFYSCFLLVALAFASQADAHGGRRFEIAVVNGRLVAQGYISTGVDDQGGIVRPFTNGLHDHWSNAFGGAESAGGDLPGFDVLAAGAEALAGHTLTLELIDAAEWTNPPTSGPFGSPELTPLEEGLLIGVGFGAEAVDTDQPGVLTLLDSVPSGGAEDLDLIFGVNARPADTLQVLRWRLSTDKPGVASSADVFTILSPDASAGNGYHHQSLHLERYLGTPNVLSDLNRDGVTTVADYTAWAATFGEETLFAGVGADANHDQTINAADFVVYRDSVATTLAAATSIAVPEPHSALLAAFALLGSAGVRRRK